MKLRKKKKWGLLGSSGKMGLQIIKTFSESAQFSQNLELVFEDSGRNEELALKKLFDGKPEILVDFSRPEALLPLSLALKKIKCFVLVCSTGWTQDQKAALIKNLGQKNVEWLPNTSFGVDLLLGALKSISKKIGTAAGTKITLFEAHHIHKKDAPSGTALWIKDVLKENLGDHCPEIEIQSKREGEIIGIHKIVFELPYEKLEICHEALDRKVFALGVLKKCLAPLASHMRHVRS